MTFPKVHVNGEVLDAAWVNDLEQRIYDAYTTNMSVPTVVTVNDDYVIGLTDTIIFADATIDAFSITIPDATTASKVPLYIAATTVTSNIVTIVPVNGKIIPAAQPAETQLQLGTIASGCGFASVMLVTDGADWRIV